MLGLLALLVGCTREAPPPVYDFVIRTWSDPGVPLPAVPIYRYGKRIAITDSGGSARLRVTGIEGEAVPLSIPCPAGHRQATEGVTVVLKSIADTKHVPEYAVTCLPQARHVVIAIRLQNGGRLPVLYLGQEVARTDESGTAHVLMTQPANSQFELTIGTDEPSSKYLRPQNPSAKFTVHDQDDLLPLVQKFVVNEPKARPRPKAPGPIRI